MITNNLLKLTGELNQQQKEAVETENILRMDKKVKGVSFDTDLKESSNRPKHDDMHEIILKDEKKDVSHEVIKVKDSSPYDREIRIHTPNYDDESSNDSSEVVEEIKEPTSVNTVREPVKPIADLNAPVQKETAVVKESHIDKAYKLSELQALKDEGRLDSVVLAVDVLFSRYAAVGLSGEMLRLAKNGNMLRAKDIKGCVTEDGDMEKIRAYDDEGEFFALYMRTDNGMYKVDKMFPRE